MSIEQYFNAESHGLGYERGYRDALNQVEEMIYALDSIEDEANGYSYPDRTIQEIVAAIRALGEVKP